MPETYYDEVYAHLEEVRAEAGERAAAVRDIFRRRAANDLTAGQKATKLKYIQEHTCSDPACPVAEYKGNEAKEIDDYS